MLEKARRYQRSVLNVSRPEPATTKQDGRKDPQLTGVYALRNTMKKLEPKPIDGRSRAGKLRKRLFKDMGGKSISAQSEILADAIMQTKLLHGRVAESLSTLPVVNRRKHYLYPAVVEAIRLTDSLAKLIALAGTEKAPELDLARRLQLEQLQSGGK